MNQSTQEQMKLTDLLEDIYACKEARDWIEQNKISTIEQAVEKCERGDWLLWLASKSGIDFQRITLAKGLCANTVRYLMKDERSRKAVDTAIAFGRGEVTRQELDHAAAYAAYAANAAAYAADAAANAAAYDANAAANAAAYDANAAANAAAYDANAAANAADAANAAADAAANAADAANAVKKSNQIQTANICREVFGVELIEKVNELLK
jgi:hypothetical protein